MSVAGGERVEIFFAEDKNLHNYYCVEINPKGHVLDYQASTYRKFNTDWDFPGLDVATMINDDGYVVEAKIPRQTLVDLKLSDEEFDAPVLTGLFSWAAPLLTFRTTKQGIFLNQGVSR